jgi:hypothetical protein
MRRPITVGAGWAAAALGGIVVATPARGQDSNDHHVYSFREGAACRDADGRVRDGPIKPPPVPTNSSIPAAMTPFGMIRIKGEGSSPDCYFYMFEVGLDPNGTPGSTSCPQVAVGQEKSSFTGTRGNAPHCPK